MNSVGKNGQPSMEEILASIRRIVADDTNNPAPLIDVGHKDSVRPVGAHLEEGGEFELPSMFRHRQAEQKSLNTRLKGTSKAAPIGRLTDAIRRAAPLHMAQQGKAVNGAAGRAEALANGQKETNSRPSETFGSRPEAQQTLSSLTANGLHPAADPEGNAPAATGSSLGDHNTPVTGRQAADARSIADTRPTPPGTLGISGQAEIAAAPLTNGNVYPQAEVLSGDAASTATTTPSPSPSAVVPRVMAPFRDTRMCSMSGTSKPAQTAPAASAPVETPPQAGGSIGDIVPGALNLPGREPNGEVANPSGQSDAAKTSMQSSGQPLPATETSHAQAGSAGAVTSGPAQSSTTPPEGGVAIAGTAGPAYVSDGAWADNPPPLPDDSTTGPATPMIEDATADLLRPMLRQWLTDNMPRMVEKALHIEVAESVRTQKQRDPS